MFRKISCTLSVNSLMIVEEYSDWNYFIAIAPCYAYLHSEIFLKVKCVALFFHKTWCKISLTNNDGSKKYLT